MRWKCGSLVLKVWVNIHLNTDVQYIKMTIHFSKIFNYLKSIEMCTFDHTVYLPWDQQCKQFKRRLLSSADNLFKQFGPKSGFGHKSFDTQIA